MLSLEIFESEVFAVMETLVEAAVTEVRRLLEEKRRGCSTPALKTDEGESEDSEAMTTQFASLMKTWTKGAVEKISMLLTVSMGQCECGAVAEKSITLCAGQTGHSKELDDVSRREQNDNQDVVTHEENNSRYLSDKQNTPLTESESDVAEVVVQLDIDSSASKKKSKKNKKAHPGPIKCPCCDKTFALKCFFDKHFLYHSKPHLCSECGKRFARPEGLAMHSRRHSGDKPFKCCQCGTKFAYKSSFNRHVHQHSVKKERSYTCTLCEGEFVGLPALQRHRCPAVTKPFVCSLCPTTFECRESLAEHENQHSGDRHFVCETCGKSFLSSLSLSTHRVTHIQTNSRCEELGLSSSNVSVSRNHLRTRTEEQPLTCEVCGKGCSHQSALKYHMQTHTKRLYVCETCGKRCGHASALQNHMRIHTGQKPGQPFACNVCGKHLGTRARLRYHMNMHTGEKPFTCDQCGKSFARPNSLKSHWVVHTREKRYACIVCGRRFTQPGSLKMHQRLHTGEKLTRSASVGKETMTVSP
ncbi:oocyte zinc finger protein XlCOF6-like [Thalassophryne amazonica]|uniref:oocyte zinc finger protein XlCOF6-like n=1 Tax=Thalassophryne amazonica TaxID=390379 RepID=UPI001471D8FA|nr:oocyte zinc finger protein XlCOF6-like [Thalassophryne amazonica]